MPKNKHECRNAHDYRYHVHSGDGDGNWGCEAKLSDLKAATMVVDNRRLTDAFDHIAVIDWRDENEHGNKIWVYTKQGGQA